MAAQVIASDKPAVKRGRLPPLLVGLAIIAAVSAGYLGWKHLAHSPDAGASEPAPPVPVIAATVQTQDFPIVRTGIGNVTALNSATVLTENTTYGAQFRLPTSVLPARLVKVGMQIDF